MFCNSCGMRIGEVVDRCPKCGMKLVKQESVEEKRNLLEKKKQKKKIALAICAVVVCVVLFKVVDNYISSFGFQYDVCYLPEYDEDGKQIGSISGIEIENYIKAPWEKNKTITELVIPSEIKVKGERKPLPVISIRATMLEHNNTVSKVVIPDSVLWIASGYNADNENVGRGNDAITHINLPDNLVHIGGQAFKDWDGLQEIECPDRLRYIKQYTFAYCDNLESVVLPMSLQTIGDNAFSGCENLKEIELPDGLKTIEYEAFKNCSSLEYLEIPDSVECIEWGAFSGCSNLTIRVPASVASKMPKTAFKGCEEVIIGD